MKMRIPYKVIKSNRKTIAIQIKPNGEVVVRYPKRMRLEEIYAFVEKKSDWIEQHLAKPKSTNSEKFTQLEIRALQERAREVVTRRVHYFAPIIGVTYNRISIRAQHSRWGSCSSKGNLNFNCPLALVPEAVLDYVVVHELCHRLEMNHSVRFWSLVERILPDYADRKKWLKDHGNELIARL